LHKSLSPKSFETDLLGSKPIRNGRDFFFQLGREVLGLLKIWSQIGLKRLGERGKLETQRETQTKQITLKSVAGEGF
jgi:hypothetical protein